MMKYPKFTPSGLFFITFFSSLSISWIHPWYLSDFTDDNLIRLTGLVFLVVSLILNTLAYREFKKSFTPYAPFSTPKVLLQKGIFTFSRNPVYLALVLSEFGLGFVFDSVWLVLGSLILLITLHFVIIMNEERILEHTFKESYRDYKGRTRRWL